MGYKLTKPHTKCPKNWVQILLTQMGTRMEFITNQLVVESGKVGYRFSREIYTSTLHST